MRPLNIDSISRSMTWACSSCTLATPKQVTVIVRPVPTGGAGDRDQEDAMRFTSAPLRRAAASIAYLQPDKEMGKPGYHVAKMMQARSGDD